MVVYIDDYINMMNNSIVLKIFYDITFIVVFKSEFKSIFRIK